MSKNAPNCTFIEQKHIVTNSELTELYEQGYARGYQDAQEDERQKRSLRRESTWGKWLGPRVNQKAP